MSVYGFGVTLLSVDSHAATEAAAATGACLLAATAAALQETSARRARKQKNMHALVLVFLWLAEADAFSLPHVRKPHAPVAQRGFQVPVVGVERLKVTALATVASLALGRPYRTEHSIGTRPDEQPISRDRFDASSVSCASKICVRDHVCLASNGYFCYSFLKVFTVADESFAPTLLHALLGVAACVRLHVSYGTQVYCIEGETSNYIAARAD